jgi:DNA-binding CsgD family transcriptional regulator/tetratricopeptide (TPR) repeat protein
VASASSPILVGRKRELGRLIEAVDVAAQGRPQLVVVSGEAGIGKSRLLAELVGRSREAGSRILAGGCLEIGEASVPYLALAEALRGLGRETPPDELAGLLGPTREDLATIAPELAGSGADVADPAADGSVGQARLFERMLQLVGRLGDPRPLVVVVEDVQWIDRATRDLITFLVRNVTTEHVAAFLTVRSADLPPGHPNLAWLAELGRAPGGVRVPLQPLDRSEIAAQIEAILGRPPEPDLVDRVWRRSEGNPFFAEELLAAGGATAGDGAAGTLVEIMLGRLRGLDRAIHDVVGAVALAGRPVDERLLAAVLDAPPAEVRSALREAADRHVVRQDESGGVTVRHELLREVIEQQMLAGDRRHLHERFATVLTAQPGLAAPSPAEAAGELARHWASAERVDEAYAAAIAAARAAEAVYAHADAFREYERARELEDRLPADARPSPADRLELRRRGTDAADLAGAFERAIELAREALVLADELGDPIACGLMHSRLGYLRWAVGDAAGGLEDHREAVRIVPDEPPTAARARVLAGLAGSLMGPDGYPESADLARAAIVCARSAGAVAEEARARNVLGFDLVALGQVEVGLEELRRSRDLAREAGSPDMLVIAHYNLALTLVEAGRLEEAVVEAQAGRDAARRVGLERRFGFDLAALAGDVLLRLARWGEADVVTGEGLRLDRTGRGSPFLAAVRGRLDALRGDVASAGHRFEVADELGAGDDPDTAAYVASGRAELELARDRPEAALGAVERALQPGGPSHALFVRVPLLALGLRAAADLADRARAGRDRAQEDDAHGRAGPLVEDLERVAAAVAAPTTAALVDLARAEAARLTPVDADAALRSTGWPELANRLDALGDRYLAAYARWRAAEAELRARGTRSDAERHLRAAASVAASLGAEPLSREIVALARRARVVLGSLGDGASEDDVAAAAVVEPPPPEDGVEAVRRAGLSDREIEVLRLVAAGRSNGQIAERLFITRKTAGVHVTHILQKLAVANRVEAAMVAARLGLEPDGDD